MTAVVFNLTIDKGLVSNDLHATLMSVSSIIANKSEIGSYVYIVENIINSRLFSTVIKFLTEIRDICIQYDVFEHVRLFYKGYIDVNSLFSDVFYLRERINTGSDIDNYPYMNVKLDKPFIFNYGYYDSCLNYVSSQDYTFNLFDIIDIYNEVINNQTDRVEMVSNLSVL